MVSIEYNSSSEIEIINFGYKQTLIVIKINLNGYTPSLLLLMIDMAEDIAAPGKLKVFNRQCYISYGF